MPNPKIFGLNLKKSKSQNNQTGSNVKHMVVVTRAAMYFSATRHTFHEWVENS